MSTDSDGLIPVFIFNSLLHGLDTGQKFKYRLGEIWLFGKWIYMYVCGNVFVETNKEELWTSAAQNLSTAFYPSSDHKNSLCKINIYFNRIIHIIPSGGPHKIILWATFDPQALSLTYVVCGPQQSDSLLKYYLHLIFLLPIFPPFRITITFLHTIQMFSRCPFNFMRKKKLLLLSHKP